MSEGSCALLPLCKSRILLPHAAHRWEGASARCSTDAERKKGVENGFVVGGERELRVRACPWQHREALEQACW